MKNPKTFLVLNYELFSPSFKEAFLSAMEQEKISYINRLAAEVLLDRLLRQQPEKVTEQGLYKATLYLPWTRPWAFAHLNIQPVRSTL